MSHTVKAPSIALLGLTAGSAVMGMTLLTPALPLIKQGFAATDDMVQLIITVYVATLAIAQLIFGPVSDRHGRRPVLITGATLILIGGLLSLLVQSIEGYIIARAIQGVGAAACLAMARTIINDCFERQEAAKAMSAVQTVQAVVPMMSILIGGVLAEYTQWHGANTAITIAGVALLIGALWFIQESHFDRIPSIKPKPIINAYMQVLRNRLFLAFAMTSGMQVGMFIALNGFLPFQYERLGISPMAFGFWFVLTPISYFTGNLLNRLFFVKRGIEKVSIIGTYLTLTSIICMTSTHLLSLSNPLFLALSSALLGFSNGLVIANTTIGAISSCERHQAGTGSGITGAWQMAAGGLAGSIIIAFGGAVNFYVAMVGMFIMSSIAIFSVNYARANRL